MYKIRQYSTINSYTKLYNTSGRGRLLGPTLGLEKKLHTDKKLNKKIQDAHNGIKIGTSNIIGGA